MQCCPSGSQAFGSGVELLSCEEIALCMLIMFLEK